MDLFAPWRVDESSQHEGTTILDSSGHTVAHVYWRDPAKAILALPQLLAALERIAIVPCNCANDALPGDECESCIARAAIAAATK